MSRYTARLDADHDAKPTAVDPSVEKRCVTCEKPVHWDYDEKAWRHGSRAAMLSFNDGSEERERRIRLKREFGEEGLREIGVLVAKVESSRPGIPEKNAWEWAEKTYRNNVFAP